MKRIFWISALVLVLAVSALYAQDKEPAAKNEKRIKELIEKLGDHDPGAPNEAIEELLKIGKPVMGPLVKALKHKAGQVRKYAAETLGYMGNKKAVEPLIQLLKDKGIMTRRSAVLALEGIGDNRAVEPLIEALKDKDEGVRILAGNALMEITGKGFGRDYRKWKEWFEKDLKKKVSGLIKKLGSEKFKEREAAQKKLMKIGRPALLPLIDALSSEDIETKLRARNILAQLEIELSNAEVSLLKKKAKDADAKNKEIIQKLLGRWRWLVVNGLQATIKSDKRVYKLKEKITIEVKLKNVSNKDIYIGTNPDTSPESVLWIEKIIGPEGVIKSTTGLMVEREPLPRMKIDDFVLIKPAESHTAKIEGGKSGAIPGGTRFRVMTVYTEFIYDLRKPGKYKITVSYKSDADGTRAGLKAKAWTGKVISNTIEIETKK